MHSHSDNTSHGSLKSYTWGFILSIIFTVIPFLIVEYTDNGSLAIVLIIMLFATLQMLIQLVFFMHVNVEDKPRWNITSLLFTILMVLIIVLGSIWVMYNLDYHMHPTSMHEHESMPTSSVNTSHDAVSHGDSNMHGMAD